MQIGSTLSADTIIVGVLAEGVDLELSIEGFDSKIILEGGNTFYLNLDELYNDVYDSEQAFKAYRKSADFVFDEIMRKSEVMKPYISAGIDFIPVVGDVKSVVEGVVGSDLITGEELPAAVRAMAIFGAIIGMSGEAKNALNTGRKALSHLDEAADATKLLPTPRNSLMTNIENQKLKNLVDEMYRPNAKIGSGSTADMLRYEKSIGGAAKHQQKVVDMR